MFRIRQYFALSFVALAASALLVSCNNAQDDLAAFSDPARGAEMLSEARRAQMDGNAEGAKRLYATLVAAQPTNALARLEFGSFLQDAGEQDPESLYEAIGEFRAYLRLEPNSEKAAVVSDRLHKAKDDISRGISEQIVNARVRAKLEEKDAAVAAANKARDEARAAADAALRSLEAMRGERDRLLLDVTALRARNDDLLAQALPDLPKDDLTKPLVDATNVMAAPEAKESPRPKAEAHDYRVQRGDSLWLISQREYGSPAHVDKIRDANPGLDGDHLKEGAVIHIPAL